VHPDDMRKALEAIGHILKRFAEPRLRESLGPAYMETLALQTNGRVMRQLPPDPSVLCRVLISRWDESFSQSADDQVLDLVHAVRKARDRHSHFVTTFTDEDRRHAIGAMRLLAIKLEGPSAAAEFDVLLGTRLTSDGPAGQSKAKAPHSSGYLDPEGLTAEQVQGRKLLCPACKEPIFKSWSSGWDGHAGHRCEGLSIQRPPLGDPAARKAEFKRRFRHLFR
jgi:hypothetical protein